MVSLNCEGIERILELIVESVNISMFQGIIQHVSQLYGIFF